MAYGFLDEPSGIAERYGFYGLSSRLSVAHGEISWISKGDVSTSCVPSVASEQSSSALEMTIVVLVLLASLAYACWWGWQKIKNAKDPCEGCSGCQLKDLKNCQKQKKSCCNAKK